MHHQHLGQMPAVAVLQPWVIFEDVFLSMRARCTAWVEHCCQFCSLLPLARTLSEQATWNAQQHFGRTQSYLQGAKIIQAQIIEPPCCTELVWLVKANLQNKKFVGQFEAPPAMFQYC